MQKILVDGYNVIHADTSLKLMLGRSVEEARQALTERVRVYVEQRSILVTLVFDGVGSIVDGESVVPGRLQVLYSAGGESADEVIVRTVEEHPNPREFIVVTSDMNDIGRATRALGANLMTSEDFLARIGADPGPGPGDFGERKPAPDADDVSFWLEEFEKKRRTPENE